MTCGPVAMHMANELLSVPLASTAPDGLEWSYRHRPYPEADTAVENDSPVVKDVEAWQGKWTPMPNYAEGWTSLAGLIGTAVTLLLVHAAAVALRKRRAARSAEP